MEEHAVVKKRSVAELAGKFSCPIAHVTDAEVNKPVRRRPPRSLPLPTNNDAAQAHEEKGAETVSTRKNRNSALIEKLQANLTLSPTGPPVFPKSPGIKLVVPCFSPGSPSSPSSPPVTGTPKEEETAASFESPVDGSVLKSINKGRARLSIKRRPPSRRHRKSSADEAGDEMEKTASSALENTTPNGHEGDVFEEQTPDAETLKSTKEQTEEETKPEPEKAEPEDTEEPKALVEDTEEPVTAEEKEEKTEPEEEEKSKAEAQSIDSTEETREEPITQPKTDPESEPDSTQEKEEKHKEEEDGNH
ncbi:duboraya isoform X2 [Danio aesculapii]|uniref:duboraya isoform X2 n=1 Tax=Danio aesculapii TaxID=1142201 RepID=UPI0024BFDD7E|nr:duboraya isoform X2 [Danio aesculapii]